MARSTCANCNTKGCVMYSSMLTNIDNEEEEEVTILEAISDLFGFSEALTQLVDNIQKEEDIPQLCLPCQKILIKCFYLKKTFLDLSHSNGTLGSIFHADINNTKVKRENMSQKYSDDDGDMSNDKAHNSDCELEGLRVKKERDESYPGDDSMDATDGGDGPQPKHQLKECKVMVQRLPRAHCYKGVDKHLRGRFRCTKCPKVFSLASLRKQHEQTHVVRRLGWQKLPSVIVKPKVTATGQGNGNVELGKRTKHDQNRQYDYSDESMSNDVHVVQVVQESPQPGTSSSGYVTGTSGKRIIKHYPDRQRPGTSSSGYVTGTSGKRIIKHYPDRQHHQDPEFPQSGPSFYKCNKCTKKFTVQHEWITHTILGHASKVEVRTGKFKCLQCKFYTESEFKFVSHVLRHARTAQEECVLDSEEESTTTTQKKCNTKSQVQVNDDSPVSFKSGNSVQNRRVQPRRYQCIDCEESFKYCESLMLHVKKVHRNSPHSRVTMGPFPSGQNE